MQGPAYALYMILSAKDVDVPIKMPGMTHEQCLDEMKYAKGIAAKIKGMHIAANCRVDLDIAPGREHGHPIGPDGKMQSGGLED